MLKIGFLPWQFPRYGPLVSIAAYPSQKVILIMPLGKKMRKGISVPAKQNFQVEFLLCKKSRKFGILRWKKEKHEHPWLRFVRVKKKKQTGSYIRGT